MHLDSAFDDHQHEVAAVALADDLHGGLGAVHVHEVREGAHLGEREMLEQIALRDKRLQVARELGGIAEKLQVF